MITLSFNTKLQDLTIFMLSWIRQASYLFLFKTNILLIAFKTSSCPQNYAIFVWLPNDRPRMRHWEKLRKHEILFTNPGKITEEFAYSLSDFDVLETHFFHKILFEIYVYRKSNRRLSWNIGLKWVKC